MKTVLDHNGNILAGLYQKPDGSFIVKDDAGLNRARTSTNAVQKLHEEVADLHKKMEFLYEKIMNK